MPLDDDKSMGGLSEALCNSCKHAHDNYPPTCKAFPKGIPAGILEGTLDHRQPVRGDKGIQYESA